jgi:PEP-CTERM motif
MKHLSHLVFAVALLGLVAAAVQPARADTIDPTIQAGVASTLPATLPTGATTATETSNTFTDYYNPTTSVTNYLAYYLNDTSSTWTDMTIVAVDGGSTNQSHSYTNEAFNSSLFPTGTAAAFSTITAANPDSGNGGTLVTFAQSGGTGVAPGDYLVIRYNNWIADTDPYNFSFTMSTAESEGVPEPSSIALLGIGLLALFGLAELAKRRKAGIAVA